VKTQIKVWGWFLCAEMVNLEKNYKTQPDKQVLDDAMMRGFVSLEQDVKNCFSKV
jgi:hypothetical protein